LLASPPQIKQGRIKAIIFPINQPVLLSGTQDVCRQKVIMAKRQIDRPNSAL
jgi:hypothetical protein